MGCSKLQFHTWTYLPSTIRHPGVNRPVAGCSCCSWWKYQAWLTWEGVLQAEEMSYRGKTMRNIQANNCRGLWGMKTTRLLYSNWRLNICIVSATYLTSLSGRLSISVCIWDRTGKDSGVVQLQESSWQTDRPTDRLTRSGDKSRHVTNRRQTRLTITNVLK